MPYDTYVAVSLQIKIRFFFIWFRIREVLTIKICYIGISGSVTAKIWRLLGWPMFYETMRHLLSYAAEKVSSSICPYCQLTFESDLLLIYVLHMNIALLVLLLLMNLCTHLLKPLLDYRHLMRLNLSMLTILMMMMMKLLLMKFHFYFLIILVLH